MLRVASNCARVAISLLTFFVFFAQADEKIELFGSLPQVNSMAISPDGKHLAFILSMDGKQRLAVVERETGKAVGGFLLADEVKARRTYFVNNEQVILTASDTKRQIGYRGKFEYSGSFAYSLSSKKPTLLLAKTEGLHPAQSGLGDIVGLISNSHVLMPAYVDSVSAEYDLFKVSLKSGLGRRFKSGRAATKDWFANREGQVVAREDFKAKSEQHRIYSYLNGKPELVYENKTARPTANFFAVSSDGEQLVFSDDDGDADALYKLNLASGNITGPFAKLDNRTIDHVLRDNRSQHIATVYGGLTPFYAFTEQRMQQLYQRLLNTFPNSSVHYVDATDNFELVIVRVSGNYVPHSYLLFDTNKVELELLASGYPQLTVDDLGEVQEYTYQSRDGWNIPSVLTWPRASTKERDREKLPLLVIPHGGPEAHDQIRFDWLAQYFANKGYLILQPNFRGSDGFGRQHIMAGRKQWGQRMQDDVSDGVRQLVNEGVADGDRVCIMGGSYGGYSALAGGALTPELYRCIVSINGVADLPTKMNWVSQRYGSTHVVYRYWQEQMGDTKTNEKTLKRFSPARLAHSFSSPVLLIHARDDTVVPFLQSRKMHKALRKADKLSELVSIKGEDHWLSYADSRKRVLMEVDRFLTKYNPVKVSGQATTSH
ncbi:MAG: prolyl oligopeptidase family serine peptidase [Pseudomonadota bacterium]